MLFVLFGLGLLLVCASTQKAIKSSRNQWLLGGVSMEAGALIIKGRRLITSGHGEGCAEKDDF